MKLPSDLAMQRAAQAWCAANTSHKEMDAELCTAFAVILDHVWNQPWLGNATTKELLDEIATRVDLNYRTVDNDGGQ